MRKNFLVFGNPLIEQQEIDEVVVSRKRGWLRAGPRVRKFEEMLRNYKGSRHAMAKKKDSRKKEECQGLGRGSIERDTI